MKRIYLLISLLVFATACQEKYEFNSGFSVPTTLTSPASVIIDVTSSATVKLTWSGGGADDGGAVIYEVLFDKPSGDFSNPVSRMYSDLKLLPSLTLSHASINAIARSGGIKPNETASLKWTVVTSKGGVKLASNESKSISLTRGEGIDNIPSELYLIGDGAENGVSAKFRTEKDGVFVIYTKLNNGSVKFKSSTATDAREYYYDTKLKEGEGSYTTSATTGPVRMTLDMNTLSLTVDEIDPDVKMIWGWDFNVIAKLSYTSNGIFVGDGKIEFLQVGWAEERYYFIAKVNGVEVCWGRHDSVSAERPSGNEPPSFYALYEFTWSQWEHLWKMAGSLDKKTCTVTIDTNDNGLMLHKFSNIQPIP